MAGIQDRLKEDLKASLKGGDSFRVGVLRMMLSELQNKEKEKFARLDSAARQAKGGALDENEAISVFQRESKKRRESIELFKKGQREDLVKKEEAELKIIGEYLPEQMSSEEAAAFVDKLIGRGFKDFNSLMKESMKELKGKIDGQKLAEIIKGKLK